MTVVNRRTFVVKRGHMQDALNVLRQDKDTKNVRRAYRRRTTARLMQSPSS